jgi:tetratricopeptide (TPR) repeat protein
MTETPESRNKQPRPPADPPELIPPDASEPGPRQTSHSGLLLVVVVGLVLVVAAIGVLLLPLLSGDSSVVGQDPVAKTPIATAPVVRPAEPAADEATDEAFQEVDRLFGEWLKKQAGAEAANITAWGDKPYADALALADDCNRLLGEGLLPSAKAACDEAITLLDGMMEARPVLLAEELQAGSLALDNGDPAAAKAHFQRALAVEPGNLTAVDGLERATRLPEVLALLQTARVRQQAGNQSGALDALTAASALDPDYRPTRQALTRIRSGIAEQGFQEAMTQALAALTQGRLTAAGKALRQARALKPDDPAVLDLGERLQRAELARQLDALRKEAATLEASERWADALKICERALALDPLAAFAVSCKDRVGLRFELDQRLRAILARPERLFDDGPLEEARVLLAQAVQVTPRGPLLNAQIEKLTRLVTTAEVEVEVILRSDALTDIVIYHVGRLGRFEERRLWLRTGDYTVVGSRDGFRDVRRLLKVRPGSGPVEFLVTCEEPI